MRAKGSLDAVCQFWAFWRRRHETEFKARWAPLLPGGSLTENMIQATGRDVFAEAVLRLEDAGYIPVLSIHDEIVLEVPTGTDPQTVENIMAAPVSWLPGLSLGAEAKVLTYYQK